MQIIGLTGGIGSGKTTVARVFELLGIDVYYADIQAKKILSSDKIKEQIISAFGNVYKDNKLQNKKLAEIVFNDKKKLEKLNSIVHPAVEKDFEQWSKKNSGKPYLIKEAAILFESGSYKKVDKIITVFAPENIRILRVCKRDNINKAQVIARINNQMPDNEKIAKSDFVIKNYNGYLIIPQIIEIDNALRSE
jgi:dephospho-CoA kinase